jgi:hypothetical protein
MFDSLYFRLHESMHTTPISALGVGKSVVRLQDRGLETIGALLGCLEVDPGFLRTAMRLPRDEVRVIESALTSLSEHVDDDGFIGWRSYYAALAEDHGLAPPADAELLTPAAEEAVDRSFAGTVDVSPPSVDRLQDGRDFVSAIPKVVSSVIDSCASDIDRLVLSERILKFPEERMTLEAVALASTLRVTRERVRQRESKLIQSLVAAFLSGRQRKVCIPLPDGFVDYWQRAAAQFSGRAEVGFSEFVSGLESAWDAPSDLFLPHLPLILTVLTSKASVPEALRAQMKMDLALLRPLDESIRAVELRSIPLGVSASDLAELGVRNLGELWDSFKNGQVAALRSRTRRDLREAATLLTQCMSGGQVDLAAYAKLRQIPVVPAVEPCSGFDFLQCLPTVMEEIVTASASRRRSVEIYKARIAVSRAVRPTLEQVGASLDTFGSSVKRDESVLLGLLNSLLVQQDLSDAKVFVRAGFLEYWTRAAGFYRESGGDFNWFLRHVGDAWGMGCQAPEVAIEILWAVLKGHPQARPGRRPSGGGAQAPARLPEMTGLVRLRGFRRVH